MSKWSPNNLKNAAFSQEKYRISFPLTQSKSFRILNFEVIHRPVLSEISDLQNFWLHAMYACTEEYFAYDICCENWWLGLMDSRLRKCVGLGLGSGWEKQK